MATRRIPASAVAIDLAKRRSKGHSLRPQPQLLQNIATLALEYALQHRLQYEPPDELLGPYRFLTFYLQNTTFQSGAEGIRTPDLRRAKSGSLVRKSSS